MYNESNINIANETIQILKKKKNRTETPKNNHHA